MLLPERSQFEPSKTPGSQNPRVTADTEQGLKEQKQPGHGHRPKITHKKSSIPTSS